MTTNDETTVAMRFIRSTAICLASVAAILKTAILAASGANDASATCVPEVLFESFGRQSELGSFDPGRRRARHLHVNGHPAFKSAVEQHFACIRGRT